MPGSLNLSKISTTEIQTNEIRSLDPNISISLLNTDIKLQQLSSDPVSATAGQLYYNTTDNVIKFYNGTEWLNVSGGDIVLENLSSDPVSANTGQLYYNTTDNVIKFYNGTEWLNTSQGSTDPNFFENDVVLTSSYTITTNKNALTAGPVTVANGVIITVPEGSTWTIV